MQLILFTRLAYYDIDFDFVSWWDYLRFAFPLLLDLLILYSLPVTTFQLLSDGSSINASWAEF
jgi:hypothetical protein